MPSATTARLMPTMQTHIPFRAATNVRPRKMSVNFAQRRISVSGKTVKNADVEKSVLTKSKLYNIISPVKFSALQVFSFF